MFVTFDAVIAVVLVSGLAALGLLLVQLTGTARPDGQARKPATAPKAPKKNSSFAVSLWNALRVPHV